MAGVRARSRSLVAAGVAALTCLAGCVAAPVPAEPAGTGATAPAAVVLPPPTAPPQAPTRGTPPGPAATTPPSSAAPAAPPLVGVDGAIPILEYHTIAATDGRWARSAQGLRDDLNGLYVDGFRPIDLRDINDDPPDIAAGTHPVVLTFDDGAVSQFGWADGSDSLPAADSAAGILWQFHLDHPDWAFAATFFVNAQPFGSDSTAKLRWLVAHGAEIGNHTYSHADLGKLDPAGVAAEIGRLQLYLATALPGYRVVSFAFPYGAVSDGTAIAKGTYQGISWDFRYLALVGAQPLDGQPQTTPIEVPRIQVAAPQTCDTSTRRFIWWGWQQDWLPTAHLYTVHAAAQAGPAGLG